MQYVGAGALEARPDWHTYLVVWFFFQVRVVELTFVNGYHEANDFVTVLAVSPKSQLRPDLGTTPHFVSNHALNSDPVRKLEFDSCPVLNFGPVPALDSVSDLACDSASCLASIPIPLPVTVPI
ncbi:hypothetical protein EVAR_64615_1 [Eumeta japonica]|uniref:Uncharacterized protein n=1 Tax=Eumeta variegata TaxID=151549 RepID=A0A4C1ZDA7_EUMVA|nr:hypothetical protein EVAR_64615_1 [Eumeta japonica]